MRACVFTGYGKKVKIKDMNVTLLDSGHIPGGSQILIETDKKRILYTGDFNTIDTQLLKGADTNYGELDYVIIESTYANEDHPERRSLEKSFVEMAALLQMHNILLLNLQVDIKVKEEAYLPLPLLQTLQRLPP